MTARVNDRGVRSWPRFGIAVSVLLAIGGFYLGESPLLIVNGIFTSVYAPYLITACIVGPFAVIPLFAVEGLRRKLTIGVAPLVVLGTTFGGFESYLRATDDAVRRSEQLQHSLEAVQTSSGRYPASLESLPADDVPGKRLLHGTVITYSTDGTRYWFSFWGRNGEKCAATRSPLVTMK